MRHLTLTANISEQRVLAIVMASYFVIVLDVSVVITALPDIGLSLGLTTAALSWIQNSYTLCFGGLLLFTARLCDLFGHKPLLQAGLLIFALASFWIGVSDQYGYLLAGRALQGTGAALIAPASLALLSEQFAAGPARNRALSWYAAAAGIGSSFGLVLGGVFTSWLNWRWGFFINLPVALGLMMATIPLTNPPRQGRRYMDAAGAVLSTLGMFALVFALIESVQLGWSAVVTQGAMLLAVLCLILFFHQEMVVSQPLMPLHLLTHRIRAGAYLSRMLFLGAMVGFFFLSTQYMRRVMGYSAIQAGLAFLPVTIPTFLMSMAVPKISHRFGLRAVILGALTVSSFGMLALTQIKADSHFISALALPMLLIGIGNGALLGPLTIAAMTDVSPSDQGAASGVVNVAHQLGGSLGLSALIVLMGRQGQISATADLEQMVQQFDLAFGGAFILLLLALISSWRLIRFPVQS